MEIKVVIKSIGQTQQISDKFRKRDLIVVDNSNEKYPQVLLFQLTQDRCVLCDNLHKDQEVTLHFNIKGKEYVNSQSEVKYFNSLEVWKIEQNSQQVEPNTNQNVSDTDDLPF